jgi:hypothetical protein
VPVKEHNADQGYPEQQEFSRNTENLRGIHYVREGAAVVGQKRLHPPSYSPSFPVSRFAFNDHSR